jgi:hypothetical protein
MQSSSDPLKFSILYTLTALANPTGKVIDPLLFKKPNLHTGGNFLGQ